MIPLASIITEFAQDYLDQYAGSVLPSQRQALRVMQHCRTSLGPALLAQCADCGAQRLVPHSWRDSKTKKYAQRTVSGVRFLQLVLQHVLPKGFRRARNYGFLHPNSKRLIALLKLLTFILTTEPVGDNALSVYYKTADGQLHERMLFRTDEANLALAKAGRAWAIDAPGDFKLAAETYRIKLAHGLVPMAPELREQC